jgi:hypothetical protein
MRMTIALCSALTLFALSSAASAVPARLTSVQLDKVKAGEMPKSVQKDQAKRHDFPYGQLNSGQCGPGIGTC